MEVNLLITQKLIVCALNPLWTPEIGRCSEIQFLHIFNHLFVRARQLCFHLSEFGYVA